MIKKRLVFPWEIRHTITCPECGGKIVTQPLWHWEKQEDKIRELQPFFCHRIDSTLIQKIPVLTENDWLAKQKLTEFANEFVDDKGQAKPPDATEHLLTTKDGPPQIFLKHGIFPVIASFTETDLKALFLILCLETGYSVKQAFFRETMQISPSYASMILKVFAKWKFVVVYPWRAKGRARGRLSGYSLRVEVRARFEKDLSDFNFLRNEVKKTVRPIALCFREKPWRKDLGLLDREN